MTEGKEKKKEKAKASIFETAAGAPRPSLFRNYISYFGMAIVGASITSFVLLMLIDLTDRNPNPYTGLITFIAIPTIVVVGLFITFAGLLWERHRRLNMSEAQIAAFPVIDLNNPRKRQGFDRIYGRLIHFFVRKRLCQLSCFRIHRVGGFLRSNLPCTDEA